MLELKNIFTLHNGFIHFLGYTKFTLYSESGFVMLPLLGHIKFSQLDCFIDGDNLKTVKEKIKGSYHHKTDDLIFAKYLSNGVIGLLPIVADFNRIELFRDDLMSLNIFEPLLEINLSHYADLCPEWFFNYAGMINSQALFRELDKELNGEGEFDFDKFMLVNILTR